MSGGAFEYAFGEVDRMAYDLETKLATRKQPSEWNPAREKYPMSDNLATQLDMVVTKMELMAKLMQGVEWYFSGDTDEADLLKNIQEFDNNMSLIKPKDKLVEDDFEKSWDITE